MNPPSVQSMNPSTPKVGSYPSVPHRPIQTIKTEPPDDMCPPPRVSIIHSVNPGSVWEGDCTSVQMASVDPTSPGEIIGQGEKTLQFFYQNPLDDIKIGFPPVRVDTEEEVNYVVALVTEKAEEFNRRNNINKGKPVQYYSSAVQARSRLHPDIVRHIEKCFTKKGMKELMPGRKKRAYPKRKEIIKVPSNYYSIKQEDIEEPEPEYDATAEEDNEEEVDEVDEVAEEQPDEFVPDEKELRTELVETVFGGNYFPEIVRKKKPQRSGVSERHGRGGRNEVFKKDASENLVLGVVDYMLENDGKNKEGTLNLTSLFKKRGRRKKRKVI